LSHISLDIGMPSFEAIVTSSPMGFVKACKELNQLVENDSEQASTLISSAIAASKSGTADNNVSNNSDAVISCVIYIIRGYFFAVPSIDIQKFASVLDTHTFLSRPSIEAIVNEIKKINETLLSSSQVRVQYLSTISTVMYSDIDRHLAIDNGPNTENAESRMEDWRLTTI
jgi:hypothetical protein